ncbi:TetR/AcrR family transcriptional regulator [Tessaracoccus sp. Y1736]
MDTSTERRQRRHGETRDEIVAIAVRLMGEHGVGGLSLGEVARRLGVRTPSLYTYFDSKNALYDELFRRGWQACHDTVASHRDRLGPATTETDPVSRAIELEGTFVRWALENAELSHLMMTRPVPAWEPSPEAYAPSVALFTMLGDDLRGFRDLGLLNPTVDLDELSQNLANAATGVIVRQLSNEPGVAYEDGTASRHFPALVRALITAHLPDRTCHASHH